jgi:hypothetical protein
MRKTVARAPRLAAPFVLSTALCLGLSFGAGPAAAQTDSTGLEPNQCAVMTLQMTTVKSPAMASPYSGYPSFFPKAGPQLDNTAFVISQDFPFTNYGGWFLYPASTTLPTGMTYPQMKPDPGNVNPFTPGTPLFAKNRHYRYILTADSATNLAPNLQEIANLNHTTWAAGNTKWFVLGRNYGPLKGYDLGGTGGPTNTAWPDIRTYDVTTGQPVPCDAVQRARTVIQRLSPWNKHGITGSRLIPNILRPLTVQRVGGHQFWSPKPHRNLVEFYRMPFDGTRAPNNSVPEASDNCANYLEAKLNPRQIAMFRVPHVPQFQPYDPASDAVYEQTEVGAVNYSAYGQLTGSFRAGSPFSFSVGNQDITQDKTGGATIVVWPRSLGPARRRAVFAEARRSGWNLLQGNANGPQYPFALLVRVNGAAPTFKGGLYPSPNRTGAPCGLGPQSTLNPFGLTVLPANTAYADWPDSFISTAKMLGPSNPTGVQCSVPGYISGNCLRRLKQQVTANGGSYFATSSSGRG